MLAHLLDIGACFQDHSYFVCAGHSLGGALAELAAFDIQRALRAANKGCFLSCYTLGAPRLGNHAFAKLFRATVPDCWSLINDQVGPHTLLLAHVCINGCNP